jgi:2-keto-3-deoxy-L-rhamnonate aldolase RhmA
MGASGILFPRISTHVEAANAVGKMRFRGGERGFSLSHRAGYFGRLSPQQFVEANDHNLLAAVQIEDPEAVKNADKIASVPGVDVNFVGPADLQVALAENPESDEGSLQCQIREALKKTIDNQGVAGIYLAGLQDVEYYLDLGVSFFVVSTDQAVLGSGVESLISDFKPYLGDP